MYPNLSDLSKNEVKVIRKLISAALAAGFSITVFDGEEVTLRKSNDQSTILSALASTDEDYLHLYRGDTFIGWIRMIYGNNTDVVSDHTDSPELTAFLAPLFTYAESLA